MKFRYILKSVSLSRVLFIACFSIGATAFSACVLPGEASAQTIQEENTILSTEQISQYTPTTQEENTTLSTEQITQYTPDESGRIEIPVSIPTLKAGDVICIGKIPDLRNSKNTAYHIQSQSDGGSLFVGIKGGLEKSPSDITWINFASADLSGAIEWENDGAAFDPNYRGDYYVYIGSKDNDCTEINGKIVIEYVP